MQRSILRRFAGLRRATGEEWISWVMRVANKAIEMAEDASLMHWVFQHACAKWHLAGHVAHMEEYTADSWAVKTTFYRNSARRAANGPGSEFFFLRLIHSRAGRWMPWGDELERFCRISGMGDWRTEASNKTNWKEVAVKFAKLVLK